VDDKSIDERAEAALRITRRAGALAADFFNGRQSLAIEDKGTQDFVSEADRASEALIVGELGKLFPQDAFLGEEGGSRGHGDYLWIIDPIDGTSNFLAGIRLWCVSVGLLVRGKPTLGFVYDPMAHEMFSAAAGRGARLNGTEIRVSGKNDITRSRVCVGFSYRRPVAPHVRGVQALLDARCEYARLGSGALGTVYTAAGRYDAYWEQHINAWDVAAALLIVQEAGGRTNDFFSGDALSKGNEILAATPGIYDAVARLVAPGLAADKRA
jgi:myo-inositol-1(or 4)-monophosphatase